jgi:hypothetical protein
MSPDNLKATMKHLLGAIEIAHEETAVSIKAVQRCDGVPDRATANGLLVHSATLRDLAVQVRTLRDTADAFVNQPSDAGASD